MLFLLFRVKSHNCLLTMSYQKLSQNLRSGAVNNDYLEETDDAIECDDKYPFLIGTSKNAIEGFNLYGTTGKDEFLRKKLNKVKNDLFINDSKCCVEGCTHTSNGKECKRTFALHLGMDDDPRFYILAIGCSFNNTKEEAIVIKKGSPIAIRPYNDDVKIPYLLRTNIELRNKMKDLDLENQKVKREINNINMVIATGALTVAHCVASALKR